MKHAALAALVACALAGCLREAPAVDPAMAGAADAPPPAAPAIDAAAESSDGAKTATFADLSVPSTWEGSDADYVADPLRCATLVDDGPRAEGCDALPADVLAFLDRRASCEHWRGEPYAEPAELAAADPATRAGLEARRDEIVRNASEECRGSDTELAALRQRHAQDPALRGLLAAFEDRIEN